MLIIQARCIILYVPGTNCLLLIDFRPEVNENFARPQSRSCSKFIQHSPPSEVSSCKGRQFFILFYDIGKPCALFKRARLILSIHSHSIYLKTILILTSYPRPDLEMFSFLQVSTTKFCVYFTSLPHVPNALPTHPPLFHHRNIWRVTQIMRARRY